MCDDPTGVTGSNFIQLQQLITSTISTTRDRHPYDPSHAGVSDVGRGIMGLHQGEARPKDDAARCACLLLRFVADKLNRLNPLQ
jgi:hypothetical protein